jgi:ubiquinone/menaquinone biosynthesis C-methylase UbiE
MVKPRVHETSEGITGEFNVQAYDEMLRKLRDRGWMETDLIIRSGLRSGHALEIGPGPGYLGLEWLKKTEGTRLTGIDISPDMITRANNNAAEYGLTERTEYALSDARRLPFEDGSFDGVFSNGSLHEWERPEEVIGEMLRVLKPGGRLFLSDLRRDMWPPVKWFLWLGTRPKVMRSGLLTSIGSSYTPAELTKLIAEAGLQGWRVTGNPLGLMVRAVKPEP